MRRQICATLAAALGAVACPAAHAVDFVNQVFQTGSLVAPVDNSTNNGVPSTAAPDQWHLWSVSGNNRAQIGSTGRTFLTGPAANDEALFLRVATPNASENDLEGATFRSNTPLSVLPGQVVYTVMETFSDVGSLSASQLFKVDVRFGATGNALDYGGFSNATPEWSINSNANTLVNGDNQGVAAITMGPSPTSSKFPHIKYNGADAEASAAAATAVYDRSYLMSTIFRPVAGGTNTEMTSTNGMAQARVSEGLINLDPNNDLGPANIATVPTMHNSIDRVTIHLRRHIGTFDGINESQFSDFGPLSAFIPGGSGANNTASSGYSSFIQRGEGSEAILNPLELKMGIRSVRIGATWATDINLDGVVNAADKAIVEASIASIDAVLLNNRATLLQGDVTNDGVVDAADLALFDTLLGDYDASGVVDGSDFVVWQRQLGTSVTTGTGADGNRDGMVDDVDLAVWKGQFGEGASAVAAVSAVPEPATTGLAMLAAAGAIGARRRARSWSR